MSSNTIIKLGIPNNHAKVIKYKNQEITIPKITFYHRKYFKDVGEGKVYEVVLPLIRKILRLSDHEDLYSEDYEYLTIQLLSHNNILNKIAKVGEETFKLEDIQTSSRNKFRYNNKVYKFSKPKVGEIYNDIVEGMNELQIDSSYNFHDMDPIFFKFGFHLFSTVTIKGSLGNEIRGIDAIIDVFANAEVMEELNHGFN